MPHELPTKKGTEIWPNQIGPSLNVRVIGPDAGTTQAVEKIAGIQGDINHFLRAQRLLVNAGITSIYKKRGFIGDVELEYKSQFGYESLTINPHIIPEGAPPSENPEEQQQLPDFMLDGYITVYCNIGRTDTIIGEDVYFDILLNGTFVGKIGYNYGHLTPFITEIQYTYYLNGHYYANPIGGGQLHIFTGGIDLGFTLNGVVLMTTITFGRHALAAHSYCDTLNPLNLEKKLLKRIIPHRKDKLLPAYIPLAPYSKDFFPASISSPGITPFWDNLFWYKSPETVNPSGNFQPLPEPGSMDFSFPYLGTSLDTRQFIQQIAYPDISVSPLREKGGNTVTLQQSGTRMNPAGTFYLYAEFFDRKHIRSVQQSWRYTCGVQANYLVNDRPRYWSAKMTPVGAPGDPDPLRNSGVLFDLSSDYGSDPCEVVYTGIPPDPKGCT